MTSEMPARRIRLEALLAYPPTARCREIVTILKSFTAEYADKVRLDIYYTGEAPGATLDKRKTVPSAYANGRLIISGSVPSIEELRSEIDAQLARGPSEWED